MSSKEKPLERRVLFWSVLGPFVVLITLFVSLVKATPLGFYIPLVAVAGVPVCLRWKQKGLLLSLLALGLVVVICYSDLPVQQRFWHVGLGMSVALAFVVSALGFEEAESTLKHIEVEAKSRLENLWRLDETLKTLQDRYQCEKEDFALRRKLLEQEREELRQQLAASQEASTIAKQEISSFHQQRKSLLNDCLAEQEKNAQLELQVSDLNSQVEELTAACQQAKEEQAPAEVVEKTIVEEKVIDEELQRELNRFKGLHKQLREQFDEKDQVLHATRKELFEMEGEVLRLEKECEELKRADRSKREVKLEQQLHQLMEENQSSKEESEALSELVDSLMLELNASKE